MLTKVEALELVSGALRERSSPNNPFVVNEAHTIETTFGWVFFYNSKKYLETKGIPIQAGWQWPGDCEQEYRSDCLPRKP